MTALVGDAELPPKIGVHPRPAGRSRHAMPAALLPRTDDGATDLLGHQVGRPASRTTPGRAAGDPRHRHPERSRRPACRVAILDGGPITAQRTAAVSGVAIARFGPAAAHGGEPAIRRGRDHRRRRAGPQPPRGPRARAARRPSSRSTTASRSGPATLADAARATTGIAAAAVAADGPGRRRRCRHRHHRRVVRDPDRRQVADRGLACADDALVVAVDYATMLLGRGRPRRGAVPGRRARPVRGEPRRRASSTAIRTRRATLGEAILAGTGRPATGGCVVSHLGVGLADVVFADAILRPRGGARPGHGPAAVTAADVVVVGAGIMGAWTALRCQRAGWQTTLIDALRGRPSAGDLRRRDPDPALVPRRRPVLRALVARGADRLARPSARRSASASSTRSGCSGSPIARMASRRTRSRR